jgi:hypothetical protein
MFCRHKRCDQEHVHESSSVCPSTAVVARVRKRRRVSSKRVTLVCDVVLCNHRQNSPQGNGEVEVAALGGQSRHALYTASGSFGLSDAVSDARGGYCCCGCGYV